MLGTGHIYSPGPRLRHQLSTFGSPSIVMRALRIEVAEDDSGARFFAYTDCFSDGIEVADATVART